MVQNRDNELEPLKKELMNYEISFRQTFLLNISGTAKKIAERLNFFHVDSGSLYRVVTYFCIMNNSFDFF